jgi:hypothetical protein
MMLVLLAGELLGVLLLAAPSLEVEPVLAPLHAASVTSSAQSVPRRSILSCIIKCPRLLNRIFEAILEVMVSTINVYAYRDVSLIHDRDIMRISAS